MAGKLLTLNLRIVVTAGVVAAVLVILVTLIFYFANGSLDETLIFFAATTAAAATCITAYYTASTLRSALDREAVFQDRARTAEAVARKDRALRYGERWNDPKMHYARDACRQVYDHRGRTSNDIIAFAAAAAVKTNLTNMLNFFEEMAFAIESELADDDMLRRQFAGVVISVWQILGPWIEQERTVRGRPQIWEAVQKLSHRWK